MKLQIQSTPVRHHRCEVRDFLGYEAHGCFFDFFEKIEVLRKRLEVQEHGVSFLFVVISVASIV